MHLNSLLVFDRHAPARLGRGASVLEIGPDAQPSSYRRRLPADLDARWHSADLVTTFDDRGRSMHNAGAFDDLTHPMTDPYEIPAEDGAFDVVLAGQVLEHVERPWRWMAEVARVLAPGGVAIVIAPVSWPYHEAPVDCWRIYPDGMRALFDEAGLETELAVCEGLEPAVTRTTYPGPSTRPRARTLPGRVRRLAWKVVGWPTSTAVDTIGIARKPSLT